MPPVQATKSYLGSCGDLWMIPVVEFKDASMTAIGVHGTSNGFIIGADGRQSVDEVSKSAEPDAAKIRERTDAQKIFPLSASDKNIAYALAGYVINDDPSFDAVQESLKLADFCRHRDYANATKLVNGFSKALTELINQAKHFPEFEKNPDGHWKIMDAFFLGYFKAVPFVTHVAFYHSLRFAEFHARGLSLAGVFYGSDVVRRKMYDDFGNVVTGSPFAQYIHNPREIYSLDDSEKYVKGYIEACSSDLGMSMDQSRCKKIGGHIHVAELTPNGFRWRTAPISPASSPTSSQPSSL